MVAGALGASYRELTSGDGQQAPDPLRLQSQRHGRGTPKMVMTKDEVREALEALAEENLKIMRRAAIEADRLYAEAATRREAARAPEDSDGLPKP